MATVRSTWATTPILLNGILTGPEWAGAGQLPIPAGYLMVKNNAGFLYIALDMVGDRGADPGTGDYFWLTFDTDRNIAITPNRDVNYGPYPGQPNRIGRQYYLGPGTWTGLLGTPSPALLRVGFGPSPNSPIAHRIWEMRIPLSEVGIPHLAAEPLAYLRFGLRVSSTNPPFTFDYPAGFYTAFAALHEILLARNAPIPGPALGPVIGSVGLIPTTQISGGYATTPPGYFIAADEAAFGGTLNIIGNRTQLQALWGTGARKYRVTHREGSSGAFTPLLQSWSNYRWNGSTYVLETYAWDAENKYTMLDPAVDYSIDDLLIQWAPGGVPPGIHELQVEFYRSDGSVVPAPPQTLQLMIDNNLPLVDILDIRHNGVPVSACAMVNLTSPTDGVQARITVNDLQGHLLSYSLAAYWGDGASATIFSDSYAAHRNPAHQWNGVVSLIVPAGEWTPTVTCAYQFRLSASPRVTNGYGYLGYAEDTYHVTLIKSAASPPAAVGTPRLVEARYPLGQSGEGLPPAPGVDATRLGAETFEG